MKVILLVIFVSFSFYTQACSISSYSYIYKINKKLDDQIIQKSNCTDKINQNFIALISQASGKVSSNHLQGILSKESPVELAPTTIYIKPLIELVNEQLADDRTQFSNLKSLHNKSFIGLDSTQSFRFKCSNCDIPGRRNISLNYSKNKLWLSADIFKKIYGFQAKQSLSYMTPVLSHKDFARKKINTQIRSPLFSDIRNIQFYKLNKHLKEGDILTMNDLSPKNIVSMNQKIKLLIKSKNITLSTIGIAMRNGKFGDYIEVKNPKSKKRSLAKIIDYNKALIEL